MSNYKNKIKDNFTIVSNHLVNDKRLSWKAKGIFSYLASKPTGWNFYMKEIQKNSTDGKVSLQSGIKELEEYGYLKRERDFDENNKLAGWNWILQLPENSLRTGFTAEGKESRRETCSSNKTKSSNTKSSKTKDVEDLLKEDLEDTSNTSAENNKKYNWKEDEGIAMNSPEIKELAKKNGAYASASKEEIQ